MLVGVPKEIKDNEYRVGLVPSTVRELTAKGHQRPGRANAGVGAGLPDADYEAAGAEIAASADTGLRARRDDREGQGAACRSSASKLRRGQILFTYLHLAPDRAQTEDLIALGRDRDRLRDGDQPAGHAAAADADVGGRRPDGAACRRALPRKGEWRPRRAARRRARRAAGGRGRSSAAASPARHAAIISAGMGATVHVVDRNPEALRRIANQLGDRVRTVFSTRDAVEALCRRADLVIGTVLHPGAAAPKLITAETVKAMKPGSVIVDVAIDQGGCAETSRPTTHSNPTYLVDESCTTASPTCRARSRAPRPSRSTT